jgi:hypothetical protein
LQDNNKVRKCIVQSVHLVVATGLRIKWKYGRSRGCWVITEEYTNILLLLLIIIIIAKLLTYMLTQPKGQTK